MPGVWFLWSEKKNIIFQKEKGNTFTLLIIFIVKNLQKEQRNLQSPQSDSTLWTLTLVGSFPENYQADILFYFKRLEKKHQTLQVYRLFTVQDGKYSGLLDCNNVTSKAWIIGPWSNRSKKEFWKDELKYFTRLAKRTYRLLWPKFKSCIRN